MTLSCIILAGGLGTRLRSAVPDLPKCLAPIAGRPFLEWQIRSLQQRGVGHFVLALGYGGEMVRDALNQPWAKDFSIEYVIEHEELGTGGATLNVLNVTGMEEALIANGDTFLGGSIDKMLIPLNASRGELMRIATVSVINRARFGGVVINEEGYITAFLEKGNRDAGLINAGLYRLKRQVFDGVCIRNFSLESAIMPSLVSSKALDSCIVDGPFIDIGIPEDYEYFKTNYQKYMLY